MPHHAAGDRAHEPGQQEEQPDYGSPAKGLAKKVSEAKADDQLEGDCDEGKNGNVEDRGHEGPIGEDHLEVVQSHPMDRGLSGPVVCDRGDQPEQRRDDQPDRQDDPERSIEEEPLRPGEPHLLPVTPGKSDDITCSEVESSGVTGSLRQAECPFNWPLSSMLNGVVTERPGAARAAVMRSRSPRDRRGPGGTGPQRPVVSD